jgi:hypothetical protein
LIWLLFTRAYLGFVFLVKTGKQKLSPHTMALVHVGITVVELSPWLPVSRYCAHTMVLNFWPQWLWILIDCLRDNNYCVCRSVPKDVFFLTPYWFSLGLLINPRFRRPKHWHFWQSFLARNAGINMISIASCGFQYFILEQSLVRFCSSKSCL